MPEATISFSRATLARKCPLSLRSVPTIDSATWCRTPAAASAGRRLRPAVSKNSSTALSSNDGELARSITTCAPGHGLFEALAGDRVDAGIGRCGGGLVATLAQNGDGLRADQAGAADDDNLHGLTSLVDDATLAQILPGFPRQPKRRGVGLVQLKSATLGVFAVLAA